MHRRKKEHKGERKCENHCADYDKSLDEWDQKVESKSSGDSWSKLKQMKETSNERKEKVGVNEQGTITLKEAIRRSETAQEEQKRRKYR